MLLSNSGLGQTIESTSLIGPLAYVWNHSTSGGAPAGAGPTTSAASPAPKIIRDVRTVPILSENFSPQTSSTGRSTSWSRRTASASPYGRPAHAATMSHEAGVWKSPSWHESHVASDGIILALVHEQKRTAPISSGPRPHFSRAR